MLGSIQWLRGIAALMVVAFHTNTLALHPSARMDFLAIGETGVDLFFVISGFIMTITTVDKRAPGEFLRRRIIRVVPLYWMITLSYAALAVMAPTLFRSASPDFLHTLGSLAFVPQFHPLFPSAIWPVVIPGWSLNYEMFFYGIFALALLF